MTTLSAAPPVSLDRGDECGQTMPHEALPGRVVSSVSDMAPVLFLRVRNG
jgi:hypothetical protein